MHLRIVGNREAVCFRTALAARLGGISSRAGDADHPEGDQSTQYKRVYQGSARQRHWEIALRIKFAFWGVTI
jgi:hypothetical protein